MKNTDAPTFWTPTPYVAGSDTSRERAQQEDRDGTTSKRRGDILELLRTAGPAGLTWHDIANATGLHHGQVSGTLSTLHKDGTIACLTTKRNKCHPYIHLQWANHHADHEITWNPTQTLAGRKTAATQDVIDAARDFCRRGLGLQNLVNALAALDALDD